MVAPKLITNDMKNSHQQKVDAAVERVNNSIERAVSKGYSSTYFPVDKSEDTYEDVVQIFRSVGYKIKPSGYIGGVWQLTEDIVW